MTPPAIERPWSALETQQRAAATFLGYTAAEWNESLGLDDEAPSPSPPLLPPPPPPPAQLPAVGVISAVKGKDKETWAEMTADEQRAASALCYDETMWDEGITPGPIARPWRALPPHMQSAASALGYSQADWDAEMEADEALWANEPPVPL